MNPVRSASAAPSSDSPDNPPAPSEPGGDRLSRLIALERAARRQEDRVALGFLIANRTHELVRYFQAFIWQRSRSGAIRVTTVSGVSDVDQHAPAVRALIKMVKWRLSDEAPNRYGPLTLDAQSSKWRREWQQWFPKDIIWCPFTVGGLPLTPETAPPRSGLVILRQTPLNSRDTQILAALTEAYAHAWHALDTVRLRSRRRIDGIKARWWLPLILTAAVLGGAVIKVPFTVLAQAQIVPDDPLIVTAPMDGVIESVMVAPNQKVDQGTRLLSFDDTQARTRRQVAESGYRIALADYQLAVQKSFHDAKSKAELQAFSLRVEEKELDVNYATEQLALTQVTASTAGVVLFSDVDDWTGRPVVTGERIMMIADPDRVDVQIWLPVADAANLDVGQTLDLFLDTDPANPLRASVRQTAYEPEIGPDGALVFRLKAVLDSVSTPPRLGLRGTAKIYGDEVSLLYFIARRPWSSLRQFIGF